MVVFIFLVVQGRIKEKALAPSGHFSRLSARTAPDPDYYRGDDCLFLLPRFRAVTTLSEETPDAARVIPKATS